MSPVEIIAKYIVPVWLPEREVTGDQEANAKRVMGRAYKQENGKNIFFGNGGGLVIRESGIQPRTKCRPAGPLAGTVTLLPTDGARAAVIDDVRMNGAPLLAAVFGGKAALNLRAWIACTKDEVVINAIDGADGSAVLDDVEFLKTLPGKLTPWRRTASLYDQAIRTQEAFQKGAADAAVKRLAASIEMDEAEVLSTLNVVRRFSLLTFQLAGED